MGWGDKECWRVGGWVGGVGVLMGGVRWSGCEGCEKGESGNGRVGGYS